MARGKTTKAPARKKTAKAEPAAVRPVKETLTKSALTTLSDATLDAALTLGTKAAAVTVSRPGANPPWRNEL